MSRFAGAPTMTIYGKLSAWFETGLEGVVWVVNEDGKDGYEGLHVLHEGDHLTILNRQDGIIWAGKIVCDQERGKIPRPTNPDFLQQAALGCWIHWVQQGFEPDEWAAFFLRPDEDRYRAILVRGSCRWATGSDARSCR